VAPKLTVTASAFIGPLPAPEVLAQYKQIQSDLPERIVALAATEAEHRRALARTDIQESAAETRRGQHCGLAIGVLALTSATICAVAGAEWPAAVIGGSTVLGLVAVFVTGRLVKSD
jgi:uncharacterized membrane protein